MFITKECTHTLQDLSMGDGPPGPVGPPVLLCHVVQHGQPGLGLAPTQDQQMEAQPVTDFHLQADCVATISKVVRQFFLSIFMKYIYGLNIKC